MLENKINSILPTPHEFFRPKGFHERISVFHKKFSYSDYLQAHKWLDSIFFNGCPVDPETMSSPYVCWQCGGQCCNFSHLPNTADMTPQSGQGKQLPLMVWNEQVYFQDPEFISDVYENVICNRSDPKNCKNKMIICKVHPFYPAKIHILAEECNYSIHLNSSSNDRRLCSAIEFEEWQMEELSKFYAWLYGEFPENRLAYVLYSLIHFDGSSVSNQEILDELLHGNDCSSNLVYRT